MRSLRLRFFLITWPLIVLGVAAVAFTFQRWSEVELTADRVMGGPAVRTDAHRRLDSLTQRWATGSLTDSALSLQLPGLAARDSLGAVVVDRHGAIVAASDPRLRLAGAPDTSGAARPRTFALTVEGDGLVSRQVVEVSGAALADSAGTYRGAVYVFPGDAKPDAAVRAEALRADVRRTVWVAVAVASAVAAALALLLAGPLVGQITRLGSAAARVKGGDLAVRIPGGGVDELGRLEAAFNEMTASLERAETHKRNLVHDVAHELRTPLTNIVGVLEAIEDGLRVPDESTLATLRSEAGLLSALVNDLQELSLAESGQLVFELTEVDVVAEARAAVDGVREAAAGIVLTAPGGPPAYATADPVRLRQVLRNLLRNAVAHTPVGGRIDLTIQRREDEVGILVADTGSGIPVEHVPLVWERFHRVDPARGREAGGRGIGLAIVKQLVDRMGGRVALASVEGKGSTFEVWLRTASPSELTRATPARRTTRVDPL